jgi:hypothetical protein
MHYLRGVWRVGLVLVVMFGAAAPAWAKEGEPDVPYVPTSEDVVAEMLKVAAVGRDDTLYDLGCGDGRIVLTAVGKYGARKGIGIDIDPERIKECQENLRKAAAGDRVTFLQQDLFDTDFSDASVVTLYLLPEVNIRLRPALLRQLRPGDRVVSHDFDMDEWEADKTIEVNGSEGGGATVYYWLVPGHAAGTWRWTEAGPDGDRECRLDLRQQFQKVSGTLQMGGQSLPLIDAVVLGDRLRLTVGREAGGKPVKVLFLGRIAGNTITGTADTHSGDAVASAEWRARRDAFNAVGTWNWTMDGKPAVLRVQARDGRRYAGLTLDGRRVPVPQFYVWGAGVYFTLGRDIDQRYEGVIQGDRIVGTVSGDDGAEPKAWTAERTPRQARRAKAQAE